MFTTQEKKLIAVLSFVQFNHIVDFMIIMPLGEQLMRLFQINPQQFSLLVSSYTLFAGLSGFLAAFYMDKFDRKKSLIFMFTGFTLATAYCGLAQNYSNLLVARALTGFFGGVMNSIVLSIVSDVINYERRGSAMGYLSTAFSVASIAGVPFSIYLAQHFDWHAPFAFLTLICIVILIGVIKFVPKIDSHLKVKDVTPPLVDIDAEILKEIQTSHFWDPVVEVLKNPIQFKALVFMFFVMFAHFAVIPFISPAFISNAKLPESHLGLIYLIGGFSSIITAPFVGQLSDRLGKSQVYIYSIIFSIIPIYLVTHITPLGMVPALLISALFFISAGSRMIPAQALISAAVSSKQRGTFMSLLSCTQSLSMALGAYIAGLIVVRNQTDGTLLNYPWVGYLSIGISFITLILLKNLKSLEIEKQNFNLQQSKH